jgi:uncharacterized membrane protein
MIFLGLLIFSISLPLIFRMVPMNPVYGIRIRASFESDKRWYDINAYGGRQLAMWSWLPVVAGVAGLFVSPEHVPIYALACVPAMLVAVLIPAIQILLWSRHGASTQAASPEEGDGHRARSVAGRLRELEQLHAERLVSESEYEAKRQKILREV